jgi:hypothetical protein
MGAEFLSFGIARVSEFPSFELKSLEFSKLDLQQEMQHIEGIYPAFTT